GGQGLGQGDAQRVPKCIDRRVVHANDRDLALGLGLNDGHGALSLCFAWLYVWHDVWHGSAGIGWVADPRLARGSSPGYLLRHQACQGGTAMLRGLMMDRPLLVSSVIDYAADVFPDVEVVSQTIEGGLHRYGYAQARARIGRLANALLALGVKPGDRVATLAWNGYRHFELYFAIAGIGAVCHTINPRLFPDQIAYIANHAADSVLFFDLTFQPLVEKLAPACKTITSYVLMTDRAHMPAN